MITFDKKVMNQTHIHLLITHLPIVGTALGAFVLIHGLWKRNQGTLIAAYNVLIVSAIGAGIAYATGEGAEETIEHLKGISKYLIEDHEESALVSLIALILTGGVSLIGLFATLKNTSQVRRIALIVRAVSLISFGLIARTGYLGGQIRHSEIRTDTISPLKQRNDND